MTENKRYKLWRELDLDGHTEDWAIEVEGLDEVICEEEVVDLLNEQDKTIQFKQKHIFCLQSVIQTIDVELRVKGMTKERFEEIKDYWYQKVMLNEN